MIDNGKILGNVELTEWIHVCIYNSNHMYNNKTITKRCTVRNHGFMQVITRIMPDYVIIIIHIGRCLFQVHSIHPLHPVPADHIFLVVAYISHIYQ